MEFNYYDDGNALANGLSALLFSTINQNPRAVICLATGASPLLGYRRFVKRAVDEALDVSRVTWVKLDEWYGLSMDNPATCEVFLQREILRPLRIPMDKYISWRSDTPDAPKEILRVTRAVQAAGGMDLAVLGIGKNGHIGLNEPSRSLAAYAHVAVLEARTKEHAMLTDAGQSVSYGLTFGFYELLQVRRIALLIYGCGKREAFDNLLSGYITTQNPATLLHLHSETVCMADRQATV